MNERGETILEEAARIVDGERQDHYGHPYDDFSGTAEMWSAFLDHPIEPWQVAAMMIALKLSRLKTSPHHRDHWVDIVGYARTVEKVFDHPDSEGSLS